MSKSPMADEMRKQMEKRKHKADSKDELRAIFNDAGVKAMKSYISGLETGAIRIEDSTDVYRLFQMYTNLNNLEEEGGGSGSFPSLPKTQESIFKDVIDVETTYESGEAVEESVIDLDKLSDMTDEEIDRMMAQREKTLNDNNEGSENFG